MVTHTKTGSGREKEIFLQALEQPTQEGRQFFLNVVCSADADLRASVEQLVAFHFETDGFMQNPANSPGTCTSTDVSQPEAVGTVLGRYKLLEKIGEGGFGIVYLAEQFEPVKRRVALKILKLGMDTRQVIARFDAERQALAMMDHPNIARVYDGGATENGRPYFVMELVRGIPITQYCDQNQHSLNGRLDLFLHVCQAVQHAHQKGIIHRDLKPSNILIAMNEGEASPKVIDFGIAKATQQDLTEKTIVTQFHHFMGTPAYVSPEQAQMAGNIDTRTDIYSLGVLLYELLTGETPFGGKELLKSGLDEMRRTICEKEPVRPSARVRRDRAEAHASKLTPSKSALGPRASAIDADLDWIVMKCLEKNPGRRYESTSELAADLKRYLGNEPVVARPPSAAYRLKKFARRNKLPLAVAATMTTLLIASITLVSWQAIRATRAERAQAQEALRARTAERAEARQRLRAERRFQATVNLMNEAFWKVSPPLSDLIGGAKPREDLAMAAVGLIAELQQDTDPTPEFRRALGRLYHELAGVQAWWGGNTMGDYEGGLKSALQAIALLTPPDPSKADNHTLDTVARAYMSAGFAAQGLLRNDDAMNYFRGMEKWATFMTLRTNRAEAELGAIVQAWARGCVAGVLCHMNRVEEALTNYYEPQLARMREKNVDTNTAHFGVLWDLGGACGSVGLALAKLNRHEEALPYLREVLSLDQVLLQRAPNSAQTLTSGVIDQAQTAEVLLALGKSSEGISLLRQALDGAEALPSRDRANVGFLQALIEVLQHHAAAYVTWATLESDAIPDRLQRLTRAREYLDQAESRVAELKSPSLQRYLRHHLARVESDRKREEEKLAAVQAKAESRKGPKQ